MNKIFKIPNGELLDVPLEQEQDFLKQANAFNTQVELVLDNSTNFDMVPPKQDPKIEDTSTTTPPEIKNYSLGDGVDFALMSPNEILTMENASDYFNLRSQAILFNNNSDGNQLEKLNNDLSKMKPDNELSDEQLSYKKSNKIYMICIIKFFILWNYSPFKFSVFIMNIVLLPFYSFMFLF